MTIRNGRRRSESSGSGLGDLVADGVADDVGGGVEVELAHQVGAVRIGGLDADAEHLGNFLGGLALGDELDDLALAWGQFRALSGRATRSKKSSRRTSEDPSAWWVTPRFKPQERTLDPRTDPGEVLPADRSPVPACSSGPLGSVGSRGASMRPRQRQQFVRAFMTGLGRSHARGREPRRFGCRG